MGLPIIDNAFALLKRVNTWTKDQIISYSKIVFKNNYGNVLLIKLNNNGSKIFSGRYDGFLDIGGGEWTSNALRISNHSGGAKGILVGTATAGGLPATIGHINAANYQANGADLPFQKYFESGSVSVVFRSMTTIAHGLGEKPKLIRIVAVCTTAINGYAVGDEVEITVADAAHQGTAAPRDATNIYLTQSSNQAGLIPRRDAGFSGDLFAITSTNFNLRVRAWA